MVADPIWHKIAEAYGIVVKSPHREITIEMNGKRVIVYHDGDQDVVRINIVEVPEEKPVLIQP